MTGDTTYFEWQHGLEPPEGDKDVSTLDQKILSATASARRAGRDEGLRAALEAARGQQSEDFGTANYYPDDDLGLARDDGIMDACSAIERLLESCKGENEND